jgi:vacuolar-type H+-ATPase subunit H
MKEIIEEILKDEETARRQVERARQEAENIILAAEKEAKSYLKQATLETTELVRQKKDKAKAEFFKEREINLRKTKEDAAMLHMQKEKDIATIARSIFLRLIDIKD